MPNPIVQERLLGIINTAISTYEAGGAMSSASRGNEREVFINQILKKAIAPPFRIGAGDVTDSTGHRTGQLDIVIENTNSISFTLTGETRLYLAEGVCAIIEVKSDLSGQWGEVESTYSRIQPLRKNYAAALSFGQASDQIPYFAVGYRGWNRIETLNAKREKLGLDGILVLDSKLFSGGDVSGFGAWSLFAFFQKLEKLAGGVLGTRPNYLAYGQ